MKRNPLLCAGLAALLCGPVLAGRPLQTDDAGLLDRGDCELEGVASRRLADDERSTAVGLQVGCGIGWQSQLALAGASDRAAGLRSAGASLGGKHGLWQADATQGDGAAWALSWQIAAVRPAGDSWRREASEVRLITSRPLNDALTLHANLAHLRSSADGIRSTAWGLALEHAPLNVVPGLAPMAELVGDDRDPAGWNLGLRYAAIADKLFFDASYGRRFSRAPASLLTAGFKFAF